MANVSLPDNMYYNPFYKPSDNDEQREKMKQISKAIIETQLTYKQRQVFIMHCVEGMSLVNISTALSIDKSCVTRRLKSAEKRIQKIKKIFENVAL